MGVSWFNVHVEHGRALVALCDGVVGIVGGLGSADYVAPVHANFVAGLDFDDLAGHRGLEAEVAGDVVVVDVGDWGYVSVHVEISSGGGTYSGYLTEQRGYLETSHCPVR